MTELWRTLQVQAHWMVWCLILYMLQRERPVPGRLPFGSLTRFRATVASRAMNYLTFILAGGVGVLVSYRPMVDVSSTGYVILPTAMGVFVVPWIVGRRVVTTSDGGSPRLVLLLLAIAGVVWGLTGIVGLALLAVCTGIGALPLLYQTSRLNLLGFWLLPLAVQLSGWDTVVSHWLLGNA